jgi:hypothetical protein
MDRQDWGELMRYIVHSYTQEQLQDLLNGGAAQFLKELQMLVSRISKAQDRNYTGQ